MTSASSSYRRGSPRSVSISRSSIVSASARSLSRPPILLSFQSIGGLDLDVHVGYAGEATPRHYFRVSNGDDDSNDETAPVAVAWWYRHLEPTIQSVYLRLVDTRERGVLVVASDCDGVTSTTAFTQALTRLLLLHCKDNSTNSSTTSGADPEQDNNIVRFLPTNSCIPMALPTLLTCLVINVSRAQASCVAYAQKHILPFTSHTVPVVTSTSTEEKSAAIDNNIATITSTINWTVKEWQDAIANDSVLLLHPDHPCSLVVATLNCLYAAPISERRSLIQHLVFAGELFVILPELRLLIAKKLQQMLLSTNAAAAASVGDDNNKDCIFIPISGTDSDSSSSNDNVVGRDQMSIPVLTRKCCTELATLSSHIGIVNTGLYRPDILPWLGASLWDHHAMQ